MAESGERDTSDWLLSQLRREPPDESAWNEFVRRYERLVFHWCRRWGLQRADAEDVTQNVLLELASRMRDFAYDPSRSFRGWLHTIAHRSWCRFSRQHLRRRGEVHFLELSIPGGPDDLDAIAARLDAEHERALLARAKERVRRRVRPRTWEAFRLMVDEGLPGSEVARRLGMRTSSVFVVGCKIRKMLQEEVERLDGRVDRPEDRE